MGTTLTGTTPQDTYDSLIKVTNNGPLSSTARYLSDGLGNDSVLALSTSAVGIGRSPSAGYIFDVETSLGSYPRITGSDQSNVRLRLSNGGSGGRSYELIGGLAGANNSSFSIYDATAAATRLVIDSSGNVGIGTSSPSVKLHVKGTAETGSVLRLEPTTSTTIYSQVVGANGDIQIQADPLNNEGSSAVKMLVDGSEIARVTSNGLCFNGDFLAANALDDYEEGTFTFTVAPDTSGSITLTTDQRTGRYTKIGRQVSVQAYLIVSSVSTPVGGNVLIQGLPFTIANDFSAGCSATVTFTDASLSYARSALGSIALQNQTQIIAGINASTIAAGDEFHLNITYTV